MAWPHWPQLIWEATYPQMFYNYKNHSRHQSVPARRPLTECALPPSLVASPAFLLKPANIAQPAHSGQGLLMLLRVCLPRLWTGPVLISCKFHPLCLATRTTPGELVPANRPGFLWKFSSVFMEHILQFTKSSLLSIRNGRA